MKKRRIKKNKKRNKPKEILNTKKLEGQLNKVVTENLKNLLDELKKGLEKLKENPVPRSDSSVYLPKKK